MNRYILGVDQGTTFTKAAIIDHEGNFIAQATREVTQYFPKPGWVEHDADEIWNTTLSVIREAFRNGRISPDQIEALGVCCQRETTLFWDKETGEPVGRAIVWLDRRTVSICERLRSQSTEIEASTGMLIIPNCAATKIRWLIDNDGLVQRGIAKGQLLYGTIDTWLIWKLSGGRLHITDYSNASVTLLLNARTLRYDDGILSLLDIPREILPGLRTSSEVYGYTDPEVFMGYRIPIAGAIGDQNAATLGQACIRPGMTKNSYGTGSFMLINRGNQYKPPSGGLVSPILWVIGEEATYAQEGLAETSGFAIQWLRDGLGIVRESTEVDGLASQVASSLGVYFVPAFVGLASPYYDAYARGAVFGLTPGTTKQHIARAVLEAMAFQTRDVFDLINQESGLPIDSLRVDGTAARSDILMQIQADILGIPVDRPTNIESAVLGAAYVAGLAVGFWQTLDEVAANWKLDCRFEPRVSAARREEHYAGWKRAIDRASGWLK